jgi:hypothetical protein
MFMFIIICLLEEGILRMALFLLLFSFCLGQIPNAPKQLIAAASDGSMLFIDVVQGRASTLEARKQLIGLSCNEKQNRTSLVLNVDGPCIYSELNGKVCPRDEGPTSCDLLSGWNFLVENALSLGDGCFRLDRLFSFISFGF